MESMQIEVGTPADKFFKMRMRSDGWDIQDDESVTEYVLRIGFPFHIEYEGQRNDN